MTSKKAQGSANKNEPEKGESEKKKVAMPRAADYTSDFQSDWTDAARSGKHNMAQVKEAILLLVANDGPLPPEWEDHPLTQNGKKWKDCRELHVKGNLCLVYLLTNDMVVFTRLGTHHQLFGK